MIYLLETSKGSWDDYQHIVIGIATCPFEADKIKQEWLVKLKEKQSQYSKQEQEKYEEDYEEYSLDINTPDHFIKYLNWYLKEYDNYSDEVTIKEIKENTILWNNLND